MKEKLSAFVDAELSELEERQLWKQLPNDAELRSTWERYHLIRATMTHQLDGLAPQQLADRIAAQIQNEPAVERLRFWPLVGGFAAAASIAAVAIFTAQSLVSEPSTIPVAKNSAPVTTTPTAVASTANSAVASSAAPGERLNMYLVGHNEFMPTAGMGGMLPYARVVTYDSER